MRTLIAITLVLVCIQSGLLIAERLYKAFGPATSITKPMRLT